MKGAKMKYTSKDWALMVGMLLAAALMLFNPLHGCHDGCDHLETRCNGTRIEVCDSEEDWGLVMDCADEEPYYGEECCWVESEQLHLCRTPEDCAAQDAGAGDGGV